MNPMKNEPAAPRGFKRFLAFFILISAHLYTLAVEAILCIFKPRYRRIFRFHLRYFRDVMARAVQSRPENPNQ